MTRDYFKQLNGDWANFWSFYAQDSFRVTPNLTLNIGMRFELNSLYNGIRGQKSAFDLSQRSKIIIPSTIDPAVQPLTAQLLQLFTDRIEYTKALGLPSSIQPFQKNWAPRIGFAWRPSGSDKWVIRSGFGIFYNFPDSNTINNTVATVPFIAAQTVSNDRPPAVPTRTWARLLPGPAGGDGQSHPGSLPVRLRRQFLLHAGRRYRRAQHAHDLRRRVELRDAAAADSPPIRSRSPMSAIRPRISTRTSASTTRCRAPGNIQNRRPYPQWGVFTYADLRRERQLQRAAGQIRSARCGTARRRCSPTPTPSASIAGTLQGGTTDHAAQVQSRRLRLRSAQHLRRQLRLPVAVRQRASSSSANAHGIVNQLVNGWELAGIVTLRSGLPFTPTISGDTANTGVGSQRPDVIGDADHGGQPDLLVLHLGELRPARLWRQARKTRSPCRPRSCATATADATSCAPTA